MLLSSRRCFIYATVIGAVAIALGGCTQQVGPALDGTATSSTPCLSPRTELAGIYSLSSEERFSGIPIGGLSAVDYDKRTGHLVLTSDDRGSRGGARAFEASFELGDGKALAVHINGAISLHNSQPLSPAKPVDVEAIRVGRDGMAILASEGDEVSGTPPGVFKVSLRTGEATALLLPYLLVPDGQKNHGPRPNRSFEGISLTPNEKSYFISLEAPLAQNDLLPSSLNEGATEIMEVGQNGEIRKRYTYPLDAIVGAVPGRLSDNGISEILYLGHGAFLVLERSGRQQQDGSFLFSNRLYCARAVSGQEPLRLEKTLVVDLRGLGVSEQANFEGMTFVPSPDGQGQMLLLVSDNDFGSGRDSYFVALKISLKVGRRKPN